MGGVTQMATLAWLTPATNAWMTRRRGTEHAEAIERRRGRPGRPCCSLALQPPGVCRQGDSTPSSCRTWRSSAGIPGARQLRHQSTPPRPSRL